MVSKDTNPLYRQETIAWLESFNLADVWRIQKPNTLDTLLASHRDLTIFSS